MITENISPEQLAGVTNRKPAYGLSRYVVVQHNELLDVVLREMDRNALTVGHIEAGVTPDTSDAIIAIEVSDETADIPNSMRLWIGVVNSNSRRRQSYMYSGITYDDIALPLSRRLMPIHDTRGYKLGVEVARSVDLFAVSWSGFPDRLVDMKTKRIEKREGDAVVYEMARRGCVTWSRFSYIEHHRKKVTQETAWSLYSCVARAVYRNKAIVNGPYTDQFRQLWGIREVLAEV